MIILKNWSIGESSRHYELAGWLAPEALPRCLSGEAYGHPRFEDGKVVTTSRIVKVVGCQVTTASGSVYLLEGPPDPHYLEWMNENGYSYNPDNPIKIRSLLN